MSSCVYPSKSFSDIVNEAEELSEKIISSTGDKKAKLYSRLQQILIKLQDYNDEKIHYGQVLSDMIETKFRSVERDYQNNVNNKQERIQSPIPSSSSTARNASIHQHVLSALPLKNSSAPGSNMSSSTNNSASENNNGGNGSGQDKGAKRARRTRTETNVDVERIDVPVKVEPSSVNSHYDRENVFLTLFLPSRRASRHPPELNHLQAPRKWPTLLSLGRPRKSSKQTRRKAVNRVDKRPKQCKIKFPVRCQTIQSILTKRLTACVDR